MGFSSPVEGGGAAPADGAAPAKKPSFGDRLGDYFESRYPAAGGLAAILKLMGVA